MFVKVRDANTSTKVRDAGPLERRFQALGFCQKFRVFDHVLLCKNSITPPKNFSSGLTLETKKGKERKGKERGSSLFITPAHSPRMHRSVFPDEKATPPRSGITSTIKHAQKVRFDTTRKTVTIRNVQGVFEFSSGVKIDGWNQKSHFPIGALSARPAPGRAKL